MPKEPELKARDKVVMKMTRDGAVEENLTEGTSKSISGRLKDAELVKLIEEPELSDGLSAEEQKRCECADNSVSFVRNIRMIPALSRLPKRLSQKRKSQKIHPRTHTKLCQCQKHR